MLDTNIFIKLMPFDDPKSNRGGRNQRRTQMSSCIKDINFPIEENVEHQKLKSIDKINLIISVKICLKSVK